MAYFVCAASARKSHKSGVRSTEPSTSRPRLTAGVSGIHIKMYSGRNTMTEAWNIHAAMTHTAYFQNDFCATKISATEIRASAVLWRTPFRLMKNWRDTTNTRMLSHGAGESFQTDTHRKPIISRELTMNTDTEEENSAEHTRKISQ